MSFPRIQARRLAGMMRAAGRPLTVTVTVSPLDPADDVAGVLSQLA
jgi:hypothetical protein